MDAEQPEDLVARLARVEAELAHVKRQRDMYKATVHDIMREQEPFAPLTPEEQEQLMNEPQGESLMAILEEFEKQEFGQR